MNMQFGFGGFNPYTGMGGGGFDPYMGMYGGMGGFNPFMGGMYGGMGGFNPFMGMYGGFPMLNPMQFFQDYLTQMQAAQMPQDEQPKVPESTPTQETPTTQEAPTTQAPATPQPFQFGQKFGLNALQGKGFTQGGINQLKQAGIVQNKQQANQMLKDFQTANAGQNVTQQQFQDFTRTYKPPAPVEKTFAMPAPKVVSNNPANIKTRK